MNHYATPADFLAQGLNLPLPPTPPVDLPPDTHCAITGQPIERGYPVADMTTGATAEFLDCFRGGVHGYVSESAARCFKSADPRKGNPCARSVLALDDGTFHNPLIAREQATLQDRVCWSDLVRAIWPGAMGRRCMIILTTDTKKRLWIRARVGAIGNRTPVLAYDSDTSVNEVLLIDWPRLIDCLSTVEHCYGLGFPKAAIRESLFTTWKIAGNVGTITTQRLEEQLAAWRGTPEMIIAALIAQKPIDSVDAPPPQKPAAKQTKQKENHECLPLFRMD